MRKRIPRLRYKTDPPPHQEVVGDGAELLVADDSQTNQGVAYDGQQGDDELRCDVDPFKARYVPGRHLRRAASSHVHDPTVLETLEETVRKSYSS